jgi:hypothetical protein
MMIYPINSKGYTFTMKIAHLAILFCLLGFQVHAQNIPQVDEGASYSSVRKALIKEGWKPIPQNTEVFGYAEEVRKKYKEVQMCAGTGIAPCIFIFKNKNGKLLEVLTVGENQSFKSFR